MKILVLDNYDSFVYNLVHGLYELGYEGSVDVYRNDKIDLEAIKKYDKLLLSPGPGIPDEAGIMKDLIREYGAFKSILGICLGHQAIAEVYGAELFNMEEVLHGVEGKLAWSDDPLFRGTSNQIPIAHYHSWSVDAKTVKAPLKITAESTSHLVMGISHNTYDVKGLQFHPESVMTTEGIQLLKNWVDQ